MAKAGIANKQSQQSRQKRQKGAIFEAVRVVLSFLTFCLHFSRFRSEKLFMDNGWINSKFFCYGSTLNYAE